jgi:hypothetical protein
MLVKASKTRASKTVEPPAEPDQPQFQRRHETCTCLVARAKLQMGACPQASSRSIIPKINPSISMSDPSLTELLDDFIRVNGFLFCTHGHEYCNHCGKDNRAVNDDEISGQNNAIDFDALTEEDLANDMMCLMTNPSVCMQRSLYASLSDVGMSAGSQATFY